MSKRKQATLYRGEKIRFFATIGLLLAVFSLYIYFLSASVVHVVVRKELNKEITEKSSYISQLEAQYIRAQHDVSEEIASQFGYSEVTDKVFITRTPTSLVLSLENES